jgi:ATP adenylyltransferase
LQHGGECSETDIAKAISVHDPTQIEYYEAITRNMVGRVLSRHGVVKRDGKRFSLLSARPLSKEQRSELRTLLMTKLDQYVAKRGERIWQHRKLALGDISGTVKYEVLKRASTRCELCGVSNSERALEVDHILPRNHGGGDDLTNLQALCYSCNAMKRDRDATDFRVLRESYAHREDSCPFCSQQKSGNIVLENKLCFGINDGYPVTDLHMLIIPKRHVRISLNCMSPRDMLVYGSWTKQNRKLRRRIPPLPVSILASMWEKPQAKPLITVICT